MWFGDIARVLVATEIHSNFCTLCNKLVLEKECVRSNCCTADFSHVRAQNEIRQAWHLGISPVNEIPLVLVRDVIDGRAPLVHVGIGAGNQLYAGITQQLKVWCGIMFSMMKNPSLWNCCF